MRQLSTLLTTDLEAMYRANRGNAEVLESLLAELGHRTRPKAVRLRADVERQILALRGEASGLARGRVDDLFGVDAPPRGVRLDWLEAPGKGEPGTGGL